MSRTIKPAFAIFCSLLSLLPLVARPQAATAASGAAEIEGSSRYTLASTYTGTTYLVDVLRAASALNPPASDHPLPVIYVLDGHTLFPMVSQMAAMSIAFSSRIPAVLVVAVGYAADPSLDRTANIAKRTAWRTRDYLPALTSEKAPPGMENGGGAADFLAFIEKELKPFIAARYPVNADDQTLVGDSAGGLFAVYTLLNSPTSFKRYLAISPSLFWDEHRLVQQAAEFSVPRAAVPAKLSVIVGELETEERMGRDMVGDARALVTVLQSREDTGLEVTYYLFPDEDHISVVPGALRRGLRAVGALP